MADKLPAMTCQVHISFVNQISTHTIHLNLNINALNKKIKFHPTISKIQLISILIISNNKYSHVHIYCSCMLHVNQSEIIQSILYENYKNMAMIKIPCTGINEGILILKSVTHNIHACKKYVKIGSVVLSVKIISSRHHFV